MIEFLLGLSFGFLAAWIYFKRAGLLRTRGEFKLAEMYGDEIVGMRSMQALLRPEARNKGSTPTPAKIRGDLK